MIGASHGEGDGTPLQYSCLENPVDRGAWWAAGHGVTKSRTQLSDFTFTFMHWRRSRGSAGEYQADVQAGVARLRWRVSGR